MKKSESEVKCDNCGEYIKGKSYHIVNENHCIQRGLNQCEQCYAESIGGDENDRIEK